MFRPLLSAKTAPKFRACTHTRLRELPIAVPRGGRGKITNRNGECRLSQTLATPPQPHSLLPLPFPSALPAIFRELVPFKARPHKGTVAHDHQELFFSWFPWRISYRAAVALGVGAATVAVTAIASHQDQQQSPVHAPPQEHSLQRWSVKLPSTLDASRMSHQLPMQLPLCLVSHAAAADVGGVVTRWAEHSRARAAAAAAAAVADSTDEGVGTSKTLEESSDKNAKPSETRYFSPLHSVGTQDGSRAVGVGRGVAQYRDDADDPELTLLRPSSAATAAALAAVAAAEATAATVASVGVLLPPSLGVSLGLGQKGADVEQQQGQQHGQDGPSDDHHLSPKQPQTNTAAAAAAALSQLLGRSVLVLADDSPAAAEAVEEAVRHARSGDRVRVLFLGHNTAAASPSATEMIDAPALGVPSGTNQGADTESSTGMGTGTGTGAGIGGSAGSGPAGLSALRLRAQCGLERRLRAQPHSHSHAHGRADECKGGASASKGQGAGVSYSIDCLPTVSPVAPTATAAAVTAGAAGSKGSAHQDGGETAVAIATAAAATDIVLRSDPDIVIIAVATPFPYLRPPTRPIPASAGPGSSTGTGTGAGTGPGGWADALRALLGSSGSGSGSNGVEAEPEPTPAAASTAPEMHTSSTSSQSSVSSSSDGARRVRVGGGVLASVAPAPFSRSTLTPTLGTMPMSTSVPAPGFVSKGNTASDSLVSSANSSSSSVNKSVAASDPITAAAAAAAAAAATVGGSSPGSSNSSSIGVGAFVAGAVLNAADCDVLLLGSARRLRRIARLRADAAAAAADVGGAARARARAAAAAGGGTNKTTSAVDEE